jgi:hypothetical protein
MPHSADEEARIDNSSKRSNESGVVQCTSSALEKNGLKSLEMPASPSHTAHVLYFSVDLLTIE